MAKRKAISPKDGTRKLYRELGLVLDGLTPREGLFIAREMLKHARASLNPLLCFLIIDGLNANGDEREARRKRKSKKQPRTTRSRG